MPFMPDFVENARKNQYLYTYTNLNFKILIKIKVAFWHYFSAKPAQMMIFT